MICKQCGRERLACVCRKDHHLSKDARHFLRHLMRRVHTEGRGRGLELEIDWPTERVRAAIEELEAKGWLNVEKRRKS